MFVIIGLLVVVGSVLGGYVMHHGKLMVLVQVSEFIIIGGAALGGQAGRQSLQRAAHLDRVMTGGFRHLILAEVFRRLPEFLDADKAFEVIASGCFDAEAINASTSAIDRGSLPLIHSTPVSVTSS